MASTQQYYLGIDVGTGSARACLVKQDGEIVASFSRDTKTFRDPSDHRIFEQSTADIWSNIAAIVKDILTTSKVPPSEIKGIGFDATCSLAVTDEAGEPVTITRGEHLGEHGERNIVLWCDHRAEAETELINESGSKVLDYVGGKMSLEMEVPKVLWLKNHMPAARFAPCQFFDLPDFLTFRATNDTARSTCSLACKCSYVPSAEGWQTDFFEKIGLGELPARGYKQIGEALGRRVLTAGQPVGHGLSKTAAEELGLLEGTPVGSGLIDAYAGWLGTVGARFKENGKLSDAIPSAEESCHRLAAVAGTSTCHLIQSPKGVFVPGVWGPYKDAVFCDRWMNEGGQSSTGQLIDFIITTHPAYPQLFKLGQEKKKDVHSILQDILEDLRDKAQVESFTELTKDLHFYPDFHGNRSPIADARMRGAITGLELNAGLDDLARKYFAALESIALQTRHIIDALNTSGHDVRAIYMSGGQARNASLMRLFANACARPVVLPGDHEHSVVRGAAMLGRFAAEAAASQSDLDASAQQEMLWRVMVEMTPIGTQIIPDASTKEQKLLEAKYKIFLESIDIQKRWRQEMALAAQ
ncbi:hypothetical protein HGRIS_009274 [Hohenbuehelia grisea]|uniref:Pentulose kinase n=1 Tax=Hohenbuehelia grisea TaxID=104357 RepID=A0ABR3J120_9AGAR